MARHFPSSGGPAPRARCTAFLRPCPFIDCALLRPRRRTTNRRIRHRAVFQASPDAGSSTLRRKRCNPVAKRPSRRRIYTRPFAFASDGSFGLCPEPLPVPAFPLAMPAVPPVSYGEEPPPPLGNGDGSSFVCSNVSDSGRDRWCIQHVNGLITAPACWPSAGCAAWPPRAGAACPMSCGAALPARCTAC
jgi:hypothetical protein